MHFGSWDFNHGNVMVSLYRAIDKNSLRILTGISTVSPKLRKHLKYNKAKLESNMNGGYIIHSLLLT